MERGIYADGLKNGQWRTYAKKGLLKDEGLYRQGKKQGEWRTYHENGKLAERVVYDADRETEHRYFDPNGNDITEQVYLQAPPILPDTTTATRPASPVTETVLPSPNRTSPQAEPSLPTPETEGVLPGPESSDTPL